jgi:class 3 adenylate cyclase/tetratricopeptide (TPR) repeat protein
VVELDTRTVTILVTDLVASTEQRACLGEEQAELLRRLHDRQLRSAVEAAGGRVVKSTGDGVLASFDGAADGLEAATAIQRTVARHNRRHPQQALTVRIGVSVGDVVVEDGDVFGAPVIEASRLCTAAAGGTILAADLVVLLARGRGGHRFEPAGELVLKGLPAPVAASLVVCEDEARSSVPMPVPLTVDTSVPLVGRGVELGRLRDAWASAATSGRRAVLVAGEPGVGKTRLVKELAAEVHRAGAIVLLGRCDDAVRAPLRPVAEVVRHALQHRGEGVLTALVPEHRRVLERLVHAEQAAARAGSEAVVEAFEWHEAIDAFLAGLAQEAPVLVVFDDLHWADPATVLLVRHLASEPSESEVLVVGTYRDTDLDRRHPLADTLADLRRASGTERVLLRGLDGVGTAALVAARAGGEAPEAFVAAIFEETEGNPFFVGEVLQHLAETGAVFRGSDGAWTTDRSLGELGIPEGVRETVGRRLGQLGAATNELLSVAAVVGREFDLDIVADAGDTAEAAALDALEPALRRGLLVEGEDLGRFEFSHALVRSTLLDELVMLRRVRLHQRIGASIERLRADRLVDHADALAYHFEQAAVAGEWDRAIRYHVLAADRASDADGLEGHLGSALQLHESSGLEDPDRELDLVVRLAWALTQSEEPAQARSYIDRALRLALATQDPDRIAIALAPTGNLNEYGTANQDLIGPVEELLAVLPDQDSQARAMALELRAFLGSTSTLLRGDHQDNLAVAETALAMAERIESPQVLARGLIALQSCLQSLSEPQRQLELLHRVEELEAFCMFPSRVADNRRLRAASVLAQLGDRVAYDRAIAELHGDRATAPSAAAAAGVDHQAGAAALAEGRLDDARAHATAALERAPHNPNAVNAFHAKRWAIRLEQDRIDPHALDGVAAMMPFPWLEALAALVNAERGDLDAAAAALGRFAERDDLGIPFNAGQAATLRALAETTGHVGDASLARALAPYLAAYQGQILVAFNGIAWECAADRALGQLALAQGDPDAAVAHLDAALGLEDGFRAPALAARTRYWLARALRARGGPGDHPRAEHELTVAARTAHDLGLIGIQHLIDRLDPEPA